MATCNYIQESKQNPSSMKAVIDYVSQDAKTLDENGRRYLSGVNCIGESAYEEFMATKNLFGKRKGTYFYHYEQSFRPGEITSYDEAHRIGIELAEKMFPGYEVLVGTHLDAESDGVQRVHNHFVSNSVSYENGKKIQLGPRSIERMRGLSDEICQAHNLSVLPEYKQTFGLKSIGTREYRAALKGDSWKFQCINDIEQAMTMVGSKDEFIALMESAGYTVKWSDSRKYITYTCPNGMKVRDNKLHESKFLKEYMQYEFTIRQQQSGANQLGVQEAESRVEVGASNNGHTSKGDDGVPDTEGAMGSVPRVYAGGDDVSAGAVRGAFQDGDTRSDAPNDVYKLRQPSRVDGGMDENARQGYEELGGLDKPPSAVSSHGKQGNLVTGWEEARRIFEEAQRDHGREGIGSDEADLGYEVVDHRDDVLVGTSLRTRIRDNLSADDLNAFFEGDENMRDDLPFDDEDDELIKSFRDLQYQARNGNVYAMYRLSRIYFDENSKYYHEAWGDHFLECSAEGGYHVAQYRIGKMLYYGIRYDQDIENAAEWLYRSAVGGNLYGATLLGKIYVEGSFFGANRNDGFRMLFQAEQDGNEFAAYTLGKYYMEGKVVKKDIAKAIEHLEKASARGNMFADYRLAQIYLFESDIFDMEKAIEYLNRSAQAGNESAAVALTRMAQNTFLTITTDILNIVGNLSGIESYRQPQDCTTIPQHRPRKERKKDREWEHTL